jgi:hypothetical protein
LQTVILNSAQYDEVGANLQEATGVLIPKSNGFAENQGFDILALSSRVQGTAEQQNNNGFGAKKSRANGSSVSTENGF